MKNKKLQLKHLKVSSQITSLNEKEAQEVKGGLEFRDDQNNPVIPNLGKKFMWTVTEQRRDKYDNNEFVIGK